MIDNYDHVNSNIIYIEESIPGSLPKCKEYLQLLENLNSQLTEHCDCKEICLLANCTCIQRSNGVNYIRMKNGGQTEFELLDKPFGDYVFPVIECNNLCPCCRDCGNRVVQRGPISGLIVTQCDVASKGEGLFTKHFIPKGTFICEYAGEVITKAEAMSRHQNNLLEKNMNYIFCLNEHCNGKVTQTFVDPSHFGNVGRYINHSCEPNSHIIPVRVDTPVPKISIFSCRNIDAGSEITFDYGPHLIEFSNEPSMSKVCLCGSIKCRKFMPFSAY